MTSNHEHRPSLHSGIMGTSTYKITHKLRTRLPLSAAVVCLVFESALAQPIAQTETNAPAQTVAADSIILPTGFNDPIEPFNRAMWGFNKGFATWVVRPASKTYRRGFSSLSERGLGIWART